MTRSSIDVSQAFTDAIVSTCRTTLGDSLRSVVYFTRDDFETLYIRQDLYGGDEEMARAAKERLVENERAAFGPHETYSKTRDDSSDLTRTEFGEYEFTLRIFSEGFVGRAVIGDHGVIVTTDELELSEFEEMEVAICQILEEESAA
ncbi:MULTISPECIES: hypothetical protein [Haloferax]|uniref:Uncharacterized protein n=2 Tax=Haloferax TaxID=2251 RepID=A0A6G1Z238_9EURY|nr:MULTISPECIES: hypothetical protein [Haloferax]KAB1187939.1 hypothetical protein Hfx1149_07800 [Haloferax sp. CBA1149]MRW80606.1 hypothetical protein [Haloferax marinisediminis]